MIDFNISSQKNLLAFSGGIDSTALFFLLLEQNIPFDIAIVDYNLRVQSKDEVTYAKTLAQTYNKECFIKSVTLNNTSGFEKNARDIRYTFFEEIIKENYYETLITAHQLNDRLEWFLMQLTRGAGLTEIMGFNELEERPLYKLCRPLINISKEELLAYLHTNNIHYFKDESNSELNYRRNKFRHNFANKLIEEYQEGIKNTFDYLQNDLSSLKINSTPIVKLEALEVFKNPNDNNIAMRIIDKSLKQRGILISQAQREEIFKQRELVLSHKIAISITENYIWIAPNEKITMDKKFKECCRISKIPSNIRTYLYKEKIDLNQLAIL